MKDSEKVVSQEGVCNVFVVHGEVRRGFHETTVAIIYVRQASQGWHLLIECI